MKDFFNRAEQILDTCGKVSSQAELTGIEKSYRTLEYSPVRTIPVQGETSGLGLRIVRNGKLGTAGQWGTVNPFELMDKSVASCRYGPSASFILPEAPLTTRAVLDPEEINISHDEVVQYLTSLGSLLKESLPGATLTARAVWGINSFFISNSRGCSGSYSRKTTSLTVSLTYPSDHGLLQSGYSSAGAEAFPRMEDVVQLLSLPIQLESLEPCEIVGRKRVVLAPRAFSVLLQGIRAGVSGRLLFMGSSPLQGLTGEGVLSPLFTLSDLPCMKDGGASAPFDSEGTPTENRFLFEKGVFQGFVHDAFSASLCNTESTGNSGRNLGEHSRPVCTNLHVKATEGATDNTLEETETGVLITDVLSAGGGDTVSGRFTFDCGRVYLFRRGKIYGYYDGCVITGNVYDALSRVVTTGGKLYRTGSDILPFISLEGISVR